MLKVRDYFFVASKSLKHFISQKIISPPLTNPNPSDNIDGWVYTPFTLTGLRALIKYLSKVFQLAKRKNISFVVPFVSFFLLGFPLFALSVLFKAHLIEVPTARTSKDVPEKKMHYYNVFFSINILLVEKSKVVELHLSSEKN